MSQRIDEIHNIKKIAFLKLSILSILFVACIFLIPSYSYAQSVPTSPLNLVASTSSSNQISLSWSAPSSDGGESVTGYRIDYSIDSGSFNTLSSNTGNTGTTYTHNNIQTGHNYNYIVYAINSVGVGSPSNIASASSNQGTIPNPPQNLVASVSSNAINLSWASASGTPSVTGYRIDYSVDSGNFVPLVSNTGTTSTTYTHTGIQTGHTYRYLVYAINSAGTSSPSNLASALTTQGTVPNPPQSLDAVSSSPTRIDLSWGSPSNIAGTGVTGYRIDYSIDGGNFISLVSNTGSTSTTYAHTGIQQGHTYSYLVYAINSAGTSSPSNLASISFNQQSTVPNIPQNLVASVTSTNQVTLSWNSSPDILGTGLTGYRIDYSIDSGNFVPLVSNTGSTSTTYTHTGIQPGHTYRYIVYAVNSAGTSSPSNLASVFTTQSTVPNPPQNLVASVTSTNQVTLSWNSSPNIAGTGLTGYRIDYSIDSGNFVPLVSNTGSVSTTYAHTGIQPGHTYRYIVYAVNSAGTSNPSNQAYATIANPTSTTSILSGTIPVVNTPATLGYSISGGQVYSSSINNDTNTLNFRLQGTLPGVLYLQLPRTLIDAKQPDGSDKTFYVIVDNRNAVFTETRTGSYRALAISFPAGATDVNIIGTSVVGGVSVLGGTVPEFPIALIGLVVGLTPAILLSRRFVKF